MFQAPCRCLVQSTSSTSTSTQTLSSTSRRMFCNKRSITTSATRYAKTATKRTRAQKSPNPNALTLTEASKTFKALSPGSPLSALELTLSTRLPPSQNVNALRGRIFLPHDASSAASKSKEVIVVLAEGEGVQGARQAGVDVVGGRELIDELLSSRLSPTKLITTPSLLPLITRNTPLARLLGPKGLMPSAKRGTVVEESEIARAVREAKGGLDWRADGRGYVRCAIARQNFTPAQVEENVKALVNSVSEIARSGPNSDSPTSLTASSGSSASAGAKKQASTIAKAWLSASQGPGIELVDVR